MGSRPIGIYPYGGMSFGEWCKIHKMLQAWPLLVRLAQEATGRARSWRPIPFRVGAAVLACRPRGIPGMDPWDIAIFTGANSKPTQDGWNVCAERYAIDQAIAAGYTEILLLVVAGPVQPDTHSGHTSITLHPCGNCRGFMAATPETQGTKIITIKHIHGVDSVEAENLSDRVMEAFTLQQLLVVHAHH